MSENSENLEEYILNFGSARRGLLAAQQIFDEIADDLSLDRSTRADATAASLDMTDQIARLDAAHATFIATYSPGLAPPTADVVKLSLDLATSLGQLLERERRVDVLFSAVTKLVSGWQALTKSPAAATATVQEATGAPSREMVEGVDGLGKQVVAQTAGKITNRFWLKRK